MPQRPRATNSQALEKRGAENPRVLHVLGPASGGMLGQIKGIISDPHNTRFQYYIATTGNLSGLDSIPVVHLSRGPSASRFALDRKPGRDPVSPLRDALWPVGTSLVGCVAGLRRATCRIEPAVVHAHGYKAALWAWLALWQLSFPLVISLHNMPPRSPWVRGALRLWLQLAAKRSQAIICVSQAIASSVGLTTRSNRTCIIPNGVRIPTEAEKRRARLRAYRELRDHGSPAVCPLILCMARLIPAKGIAVLLQALRRLGYKKPLQVIVLGDGPARRRLEQLAGCLKRPGLDITFLGYVDQATDYLSIATISVLPSLSEGMPLALLEAMAYGVPVVASRVGGIPEVARHMHEAVLVPPGDPAALAHALDMLLSRPTLREELAAEAQTRAANAFNIEDQLRRIRSIYEKALNS